MSGNDLNSKAAKFDKLKTTKTMHINFIAVLIAALVPTISVFVWYNPKIFGKAWQIAASFTNKKIKVANMP